MARLFTGTEVIDNWNPLDDLPPPDFIPAEWNGPWVHKCMTEAWRTLMKMPNVQLGPRGFGRWWPIYKIEWHDLLALVGAGTSEVEAFYRQQNRTRILPSAKEISQMEAAISWPMQYLGEERHVLIVNVCSKVAAQDRDLQQEIRRRRYGGDADQWREQNWKFCDRIADGLIDDRVMVFS